MPTMEPSALADLVLLTRKKLKKLKFVQAAQRYRRYTLVKDLVKPSRTIVCDGGYEYEFPIMLTHGDQAKMVGLFEKDSLSISDVMTMASVPLRFTNTNWFYDVKEQAMNAGPERLVDTVKNRRLQAMMSNIDMVERGGWGRPAPSDNKTIWGVPHWVVESATQGFNGQNPPGWSDLAGVDTDAAANANWRNYTGTYPEFTKDDLIQVMAEAAEYTNFESPTGADHPDLNDGNSSKIFTTFPVRRNISLIGEAQNQNLGRDVDSMGGKVRFQGNEIHVVPALEDATVRVVQDPIYMLNMGTWNFITQKGGMMREGRPIQLTDRHDTYANHVDGSINLMCTDRRRNTVLYRV